MTTAQDIISASMRKIGVLRKGETPDATESVDALALLNDIVGSWSLESLLIYGTTTESFTLSPAASYTIGSGQTLDTTRPTWIKAATITIGNLDYPLRIVAEDDFQLEIIQKSISTTIPRVLTYNNAYPYGTIKLWPTLSASATLTLMSEKPLSSFATLSTTFDMPPGWSHALKANLAVLLSPEYSLPVSADLQAQAAVAKGNLKKQVIKAHPMTYRDDTVVKSNIYTGF